MGKNRNRISGDDLEEDLEAGIEPAGEEGLDLGEPVEEIGSSIITGTVAKAEDIGIGNVIEEKVEEKVNEAIDDFIDRTEKAMEKLEGGSVMTEGFGGFTGLAPAAESIVKEEMVAKNTVPDAAQKTTGFYIPKNYKVEKEVTKEVIKEADKAKLNTLLEKELTGSGTSEVSGQIDVHVKVADIESAIKRIIGRVAVEAKNFGGVKPEIFEKFLAGVVGVSSTLSYDAGQLPLTAANYHREATAKIMAENLNFTQAQAAAKAAEIVSGYIGKNIEELKNAASSLPVKFLTLVVKRDAIPTVNGKDDKNALDLITNCFTSEFVKSVIAEPDGDVLHIAINMSRIFKYAQGHFKAKDLENIAMISATVLSTNNSTHSVVYKINKKSTLQK